jgi:RES domain-containing protein
MTAVPLPDQITLFERRLQGLTSHVSALDVTAFRSATPRYATETDLLTGEGSRKWGGRWNPPGLAAVYASLTPKTAMAETLAQARYYGWLVEEVMPRTFVAIYFSLKRILDLTDGDIRRRLAFSHKRMIDTEWRAGMATASVALTQAFGQAAAKVGVEGLLVPSAAHSSGQNIVAFPENVKTPSSVVVLAPHKL